MEIIYEDKDTKLYRHVCTGDVFMIKGIEDIYIKSGWQSFNGTPIAVSLNDGESRALPPLTPVKLVNATLHATER